MRVAVAPLEEQREILDAITAAMKYADSISSIQTSTYESLATLEHSILTKAFSGDLVPQFSSDEPAAELLRRIRNERTMSKKKRPPKREQQKTLENNAKSGNSLVEHLRASSSSMAPERLFEIACFDEQSVDDFYGELREAIASGLIVEVRPNDTDVTLEAKSP